MAVEAMTRFLILSDTHGDAMPLPEDAVDVAIHCGDLTEESKLDEFKASLDLMRQINAPLKLVIAGNHDFTLDIPMFKKKLEDIRPPFEAHLIKREYGNFGEARALFDNAKNEGIVLLDEGLHTFTLSNGTTLTVYASPYTPSLSDWGFQYHPNEEHNWEIGQADVVITHGPPRGVLDYTDSKQRAGSSGLFAAVARARPRLHCFGHIHEGWGAKKVTWRETLSEIPSHFTAIDNDKSAVLETLSTVRDGRFDCPREIAEKEANMKLYTDQRCCKASEVVTPGAQTLFVNAAVQGTEKDPLQLPWLVDIRLPKASTATPRLASEKKRKADATSDQGHGRKKAAAGQKAEITMAWSEELL